MNPRLPVAKWISSPGPEQEIVVATRVRVARNLERLPFPGMASPIELEACTAEIERALRSMGERFNLGWRGRRSECRPTTLEELVALRYATIDWLSAPSDPTLWIEAEGLGSVMVNEEDHIRVQAVVPGLQVESAKLIACEIVDGLAVRIAFAHRAAIGYLTASPSNAGTGVRLSAMLHLLGLRSQGRLRRVLSSVSATGCTVRGVSGEGSGPRGAFVQLSSGPHALASDGWTPDAFAPTVRYLIDEERLARHEQIELRGPGSIADSALAAADEVLRNNLSQAHLAEVASRIRLAAAMGLGPIDLATASGLFAYATAVMPAAPGHDRSIADRVRSAGVRRVLQDRMERRAGN